MKTTTKALVGSVAAGAMALASAAPAQAQQWRDRDRYERRDNGISAGEIIAGALIIGGIAAVASAANRGRDYDRNYDRRYNDNPRQAVEQCVYAAERSASRASYRGRAEVTDIRNIDARRDGYVIKGRIAVNQLNRDWRRGDSRYGRGWDNDYRGWNDNYRGWDSGKFTCRVQYGRVTDVDYSGIRGL